MAQNNPYALSFINDDYISIPYDSSYVSTDKFTYEAYIKVSSYNDFTYGTVGIFGQWDTGTSDRSNIITLNNNGTISLGLSSNGISYEFHDYETSLTLNENTFYHIATTFDNGNVKIFIDGNLELEYTSSYSNVYSNNIPLKIGRQDANKGRYFAGIIDEARKWNIVRTQTEIQENMDKSLNGNEEGLVAYYRADSGSGTTLVDATNNNNDGTINGSTWVTGEVDLKINIYSLIKDYNNNIYTYDGGFTDTGLSEPLTYSNFTNYGIEDLSTISQSEWETFTNTFDILTISKESSLDISFDYSAYSKIEYLISTDGNTWYGYDSSSGSWKTGYHMSKTELENLTEIQIYNLINEPINKTDLFYRVVISSNDTTSNPLLEEINTTFKQNQAPIISDPIISPESFYTDSTLTATLTDLEGDSIDYSIMIKTPQDSNFWEYTSGNIESGYEINETITNETFVPGINYVRIDAIDQRGASSTWETSVTMLNENPMLMYSYDEFKTWGTIDDEYGDRVRYQIVLNGQVIKDFGYFKESPIEFEYFWEDAGDIVEYGKENNVTINVEDEFGATASDSFVVDILERGLFFIDKYGNKYTDADRVVKKVLELDSITAGRSPKPKPFYLRNYTGYNLEDMSIWTEYNNEHDNIKIMFDDNMDFDNPKELFTIPNTFSSGKDKKIFVGAVTDIGDGEKGYEFTVRARGDYRNRS